MARKKAKSEAKSEAPKKIKPISLNILEIAKRLQKLEQTSGGGDHSSLANKSDIATDFNTTTAYTAGCFVYHDGKLYQFNADHAAGAWNPTDVVLANVTDQVVSNKAAIDGLTASDVLMSDGVTSVEDALDAVMPRTAMGTTLVQLVNAVNQLNTEQKNRCQIYINDNRTLIFTANSYFACMVVTGSSNYSLSQYRLDPTGGGSYKRYIAGASTAEDQTISKWVLYYQGTPIT